MTELAAFSERLSTLRAEALRLGAVLGAGEDTMPTVGDVGRADGCWLEVNFYPDADEEDQWLFSLMLRENNEVWCLSECGPDYSDQILEPLFVSLTHKMAMAKLGNPRVGDVPKRDIFDIQDGLLERLNPLWAAQRHASVLKSD